MSSTPVNKPLAVDTDATQAPMTTPMPEHISLDRWADNGFEWQGEVVPTTFERLATQLTTEHEQPKLQMKANLYRQNNVLHLAFKITGEMWLNCQRCLQPIAIDITDDYDIALLDDDSQVRTVDDEQDYLLLNEVVSDQTPERLLPVKKLVEDEILLKIPMATKHDDCEMAVEQVGDIPEEENENPFAALASLKGKL
ncbi:YceD family protein [Psychrobacter sp. 72-O-c]|uniref:YceD family protein n=1 Tax=Psychrobacter sp. 72-O-c TaxID=2774125 RepID=UPI001918767A|nr:YceD family protein [Psychrobacter sp. 72-O-c]